MKIFILLTGVLLITLHSSAQIKLYASEIQGTLWESNSVSVCWDNPLPENKRWRDVVQDAITQSWQKYCALVFTDWCPATQKDGDIHIWITDDTPHTKGIGNEIRHKEHGMVLNFTFNKWRPICQSELEKCIRAIAIHEFGHAIGLAHEQNRKDCNFPDCFGKKDGKAGDWDITQCDLYSIMNYCNPQWKNDGNLSELDKEAVRWMYPLPSGPGFAPPEPKLVHNISKAETDEKTIYSVRIYLVTDNARLNTIGHVDYTIISTDSIFTNEKVGSNIKKARFGILLKNVKGGFKINAKIFYKNGQHKIVRDTFNTNETRPND